MSHKMIAMTLATMISLAAHAASHDCSLPAVLRISMQANNLIYQVDEHTTHKLYTLGEVSQAVRDCSPERTLFIVASPDVPVGRIHSEPKEQIERVRYFVQYSPKDFCELGTERYFNKLPVTPDILPEALYDDAPPQSLNNSEGAK